MSITPELPWNPKSDVITISNPKKFYLKFHKEEKRRFSKSISRNQPQELNLHLKISLKRRNQSLQTEYWDI